MMTPKLFAGLCWDPRCGELGARAFAQYVLNSNPFAIKLRAYALVLRFNSSLSNGTEPLRHAWRSRSRSTCRNGMEWTRMTRVTIAFAQYY